MVSDGADINDVLAQMKSDELGIMDAIVLIRELYSISLGDAKLKVTTHKDWVEMANRTMMSDDEIKAVLEKIDEI